MIKKNSNYWHGVNYQLKIFTLFFDIIDFKLIYLQNRCLISICSMCDTGRPRADFELLTSTMSKLRCKHVHSFEFYQLSPKNTMCDYE